jgi:hypothetical protein
MMTLPPPDYLAATVQAEHERDAARLRLVRMARAARACCETSASVLSRLMGLIRRPASSCVAGC